MTPRDSARLSGKRPDVPNVWDRGVRVFGGREVPDGEILRPDKVGPQNDTAQKTHADEAHA